MQIVTVCFDYNDRPEFALLLDVFRSSCKRYMPDVEFIEYRDRPPEYDGRIHGYLDNTFKLEIWYNHMMQTTENTIFIDCDMLALKDANHAFDNDFDIAYTACPAGYMVPLNGGMIFARPTEGARLFFSRLYEINYKMYNDYDFHKPWQDKYHGMNQSAMGYVLEKMSDDINILQYKTREWNSIECDWRHYNNDAVFCHINKALRRAVLHRAKPAGTILKLQGLWYAEKDKLFLEREQNANSINGRNVARPDSPEVGA